MPYKDKAMKSRRQKERRKGEAPTKMKPLSEAPTVEMVPPRGILSKRPRHLTLSDGQVLDRANLPKVIKMVARPEAIRMANRAGGRVIDQSKADRYKRWREDVRLEAFQDKKERERLQSICASLSGHKVLDEVYLGTRDPVPMSEVAELLAAFD